MPTEDVKHADIAPVIGQGSSEPGPKEPVPKDLVSKDPELKIPITKKQSVALSPQDAKTNSSIYRRKSSTYAPQSQTGRSRASRPSDNITEEPDGLQVPPVGKIVWFAKQGLWQALDSFLDKLFQESNRVQLKFDPDLLSVGLSTRLLCRVIS